MNSLPQREFKFRVFNQVSREMIYFDFNSILEKLGDLYSIHDVYCTSNVTMQFVGLNDKNGEPIYEGDVLEFPSRSFHSDEVVKAIVYTNEYAEISVGGWLLNKINRHATKIGNIHETPELLGDSHE